MSSEPMPTMKAGRRRLPVTLLILVGLMALKATLLLTVIVSAGVSELRAVLGMGYAPDLADALRASPVYSVGVFIIGALLMVSAVGMLSRRRTGWLLAMVLTGVFVATDIYGFLNGNVDHFWMALNILTVFYLNQSDVREVVGAGAGRPTDEGGAP